MLKNAVLKFANAVGEVGLFRFLCPGRIPVFMLHRVFDAEVGELAGGMSADVLRSHLDYLAKNGYRVLSMDELWSMLAHGDAIPPKSVVFTIDDGFSDHYEVAARVFDEFGFVLNCFLITGFIDRYIWPWDDHIIYVMHHTDVSQAHLRLPSGTLYSVDLLSNNAGAIARDLRNRLKAEVQTHLYDWLKTELYSALKVEFPGDIPEEFVPMSWSNARALHHSGHGVYPHTCTHRILSTLSVEEKRYEIDESKKRVEAELHFSPEVFAYPTGRRSDYDKLDMDLLKNAGVRMAFNTVPDYVTREGQGLYELPRFALPANRDDFLQIINRFEAFKMKLRA